MAKKRGKKGILEAAQQRLNSALPKNMFFWVGFCHHCLQIMIFFSPMRERLNWRQK